jgi:hypothetical protein
MKSTAGFVFAAILIASSASSMTYYVLQVGGGSRIYSMDPPVRKGRLLLFHRYPDGTYMSLAASEVERVTPVEEPPPVPAGVLSPGQTVFVGPALLGPNYEAPAVTPPDFIVTSGYDEGYGTMYWGGDYIPPGPPIPPPPRPGPSRIGPNGFPILAPPGTPGSVPPAIGPNGYPILAPPRPVPRRR